MMFGSNKKFKKYKKIIQKSGLFDAKYYLKENHDARVANETPLDHFIKVGLQEDRKPNSDFDPVWYKEYYKDVQYSKYIPFIHYAQYGKKEDRFQNAVEQQKHQHMMDGFKDVFLEESYLAANPEIQKAVEEGTFKSGFEHFEKFGFKEVRSSQRRIGLEFPFFDEEVYLRINQDIEKDYSGSGFEHFIAHGYVEYLELNRYVGLEYPFELTEDLIETVKKSFDDEAYLEANPDVKEAVAIGTFKNGWSHFEKHGLDEVRKGKRKIHPLVPLLSEADYVMQNRDIFEALSTGAISSPYQHFLEFGYTEYIDGLRKEKNLTVYRYEEPLKSKKVIHEIHSFIKKPLISVVMPVYNVDPQWLELAIGSLKSQWYDNWELCIADDASTNSETVAFLRAIDDPKIKVTFLNTNGNISYASNEALKLATGEYVALMDNDDELTPDAFYEVVKAINETGAEFIYSDEDKLEMDGTFTDPHFKPDFAPDMFLSQNYISHLGVIKKDLIERVGGWEIGLEGAQDYDLYLKVLEHTDKIYHIPKVLYHWRKIPGSTAAEFSEKSYAQDAGVSALQNAMQRRGIDAKVKNGKYPGTYRVQYAIEGEPLVSIIVPFKDKPELLDMCINSVLTKSTYKNFEIIGISNNSSEDETFAMMRSLEQKDSRVSFYEYNVPFNYSDINNYAVNNFAKGAHVLLLNNDIEIITEDWIESLLEHSQRKEVGVVGAKLYYPNNAIQHAGVIIGIGGIAGHSHKYFERDDIGYFCRLNMVQNLSALTAALFMVKKVIFDEVKGLDSEHLSVAFNDVDFCLRVQERGYRNVFTPYCEAYHHESISRGAEDNPEKIERFNSEVEYMKNRHSNILEKGDPFYNPNLTLDHENFGIAE